MKRASFGGSEINFSLSTYSRWGALKTRSQPRRITVHCASEDIPSARRLIAGLRHSAYSRGITFCIAITISMRSKKYWGCRSCTLKLEIRQAKLGKKDGSQNKNHVHRAQGRQPHRSRENWACDLLENRRHNLLRRQGFRSLKGAGFKANYIDVESGEEYWISGPKKNGGDALYATNMAPEIDADVEEEYWTRIRKRQRKF